MNMLPTRCPICGGELTVTRIACHDCNTTIEGRFIAGPFSQLSNEELEFLETFIRHEGKLSRMADEIGLSYPTLRNRLHDIIRRLGYEPGGGEETPGLSEEQRQHILEDLDKGVISAEKAMLLLKES